MAEDQVKYSDLIAQDVQPGLTMLAEALKAVTEQIASLKTEATALKGAMSAAGTATREQQQATAQSAAAAEGLRQRMKGLTEEQKRLEAERRKYAKLTEEEANRVKTMSGVYQQYADAVRNGTAAQMSELKALDLQNKSYNELYQTYNALKDALNQMTVAERQNTAAGKAMTNQAKEIRETLNNLQQATGNYALNVGNYMSAFNGLQFQAQQLLREIPSAQNVSQFFLAISNNLPMFADALARYNKGLPEIKVKLASVTAEIAKQNAQMATMNVETTEYAAKQEYVNALKKQEVALQGATVSGWRAVLKSVGSWQTLLIAGLLLLRKIPDLLKDIGHWFTHVSQEVKMLIAVNNEAANTVGSMKAKYKALQKEWQNLKKEDMPAWLKQHENDWAELGYKIDDANKAEDFYVRNTERVQKAIDDRARSIAAMKIAAEKYEEAFRKQIEAETAVETGTVSSWSRIKQIGQIFQATLLLGPGSYKTIVEEGAKQVLKDAESYAKELKVEAEKLMTEADNIIDRFVLPGPIITGDDDDEKNKNRFDFDPSDVSDAYWKAEEARISMMEDGLKKELELQKMAHSRALEENDIYFADREEQLMGNLMGELKLLTKGNEKAAAKMYDAIVKNDINAVAKMSAGARQLAQRYWSDIEVGEKQHDVIMQSLEVQNERTIKAIRMKNLADRKKEWEENAKEVEKQEKENAKSKLKAEADNWQTLKTQLIEQGKSRKELVDAEFNAEIARLKVMLQLNRDVNGEKMSNEQRQKVEEWIALLEKMQKAGNFGDVKPGQVFGHGGANVTNERKNYANIWEVLGIDMDNNQVSALNSVFDQAKEALNSWMDARKAAADQAKELADDEVSAAENALNREIELRNQGYANDVALREKELADAKAAQEKAVEEQKKIAGEQILLDAAMQTSSMITASANIIKQFPNPLAWGPMLAVMWGAFGYAKLKAYQESQKSIKFKEGGVMLLEGGSHESGHDVNLGIGPDGSNLRAEGGEYFAVINRRSSRKYGSQIPAVVNALNSGMFEDRYIKTSDAVGLLPQVIRADNGSYVDLSKVEGGVSELVKQGETSYNVVGDYMEIRYKNLVRRVKIS